MVICRLPCSGRRRAAPPWSSRGNGRVMCTLLGLVLLSAVALPSPSPGDLLLDWSEWEKQEAARDEAQVASMSIQPVSDRPCEEGSEGTVCQALDGGGLRRLVRDCAARLELPDNLCKDVKEPVLEHDYRVPLMESGSVACGFENRMTKEVMKELASRYTFHLIGDSTSRRLGESFVSIFNGEGSTHPVAQRNRNFSSGDLKVLFYWAPHCSGPESVGAILKTVLDGVGAAEHDGKRAVFVTAFGVHDAFELHHSANGHGSATYESGLPQDIVEKDGMRAAALSACRDTTAQLIRTAAGGRADAAQPRGGDRARFDEEPQANDSRASTESDVSVAVDEDDAGKATARSSPLFFLLQNNRYPPDSVEDAFLEDLHRLQRREVDEWEAGGGADRGLFLVNDSVSLYGNLSCYRNANPIHFYEPVKIVEGKMLWDLLALVDR